MVSYNMTNILLRHFDIRGNTTFCHILPFSLEGSPAKEFE